MYNWQQNDWRRFRYNENLFTEKALTFMALVGESYGYIQSLSNTERNESVVDLLINEAIKTSAIEGEFLNRIDLASSIRRNLGYQTPSFRIKDRRAEGIAALLVKVRESFDENLTDTEIFEWHKLLMLGNNSINSGEYRSHSEPMQVISGAAGKEIVHFEAPPSDMVSQEMELFFKWFNDTKPDGKQPIANLLIRAAIAHIYFETIHPFEDGNGRIGRIIAEKAIAQGLKRPILMSLSSSIEANKKDYYEALQQAQRTNELTNWIDYFSQVILDGQLEFKNTMHFIRRKTAFFEKYHSLFNEAQSKVIARMLHEEFFEGGMNARKYQSITRVSKATATRHLQDLVEKGILVSENKGRSTNYQVKLD